MHRLTTLGALDLRDGRGRPVQGVLAQPKRVALLVFLAVEGRGEPLHRERLLAMFWPELDESHARNALSQALYHLRQGLPADALPADGVTAVRAQPQALWCDTVAFEQAVATGDFALALDLYRGPFCPYLALESTDFEHWLDGRRAALRRQALSAGLSLTRQRADAGDAPGTIRAATRTLALHPDDGHDVRALLALLDGAGDRAGALAAFDEHTRHLAALELAADDETTQLAAAIRARGPVVTALAASVPTVAVAAAAPAEAAGPKAPRYRWRLAITAALAVVATAAVAFGWPRSVQPASNAVAVFPFALRGDSAHAYLREGIVDLLSATLEGTTGLAASDPRSVIGVSAAATDRAAAARRLGATRFVTGHMVVANGRMLVRATLNDGTTGAVVGTASAEGDTSALFDIVDGVAAQLLTQLLEGRDSALTRVAAVSTRSLPALRAFLEGEQAMRQGRDSRALTAFREAATLDSTFALAHYRVALMGTWVTGVDAGELLPHAARAARHAQRLTPLARDLLTAYRAYREFRVLDAERLYRRLTEERPDNVEAWLMLGETLMHFNPMRGRSLHAAWEPFARALDLGGPNPHALVHLARMAAAAGDTRGVDTLVHAYHARFGGAERSLEMEALQVFTAPDTVARARLLARARLADDLVLSSLITSTSTYVQDLRAALALAGTGVESGRTPLPRLAAQRLASDMEIGGGAWDRASRWGRTDGGDLWQFEGQLLAASEPAFGAPPARLRELQRRLEATPPWPSMVTGYGRRDVTPLNVAQRAYLAGLLAVRLGDTAAAASHLASMTAPRPVTDGAADLAQALRAAMARARGDHAAALAALRQFRLDAFGDGVIPALRIAHWGMAERYALAETLQALGRHDEALELFASFFGVWDLAFASLAQLRRGEIYEQRGDVGRARFHLQRAAAMLADAEPDFQPLLLRARAGLARLPNP